MKLEILKRVDRAWWNNMVSSATDGNIFQSAHWADFVKEYLKYEPNYLVFKDDAGEIKAVLLLFRRAFNHYYYLERPLGSVPIALLKRFLPTFTWQGGPIVLAESKEKRDIYNHVLSEVSRVAARAGGARIEEARLPCYDSQVPGEGAIAVSGYDCRKWATYLIDLTQDADALWRSFKPAARKSVNKAERDGVTVEQVTDLAGLRDYYSFTRECATQTGRKGFPDFANLAVMWKHLRPEDGVAIFIARQGEQKLCGLGIWAFNGIIYEFGSFQSQYSFDHKIYGNDLIKWAIMKWGHEKGYRIYDLAGVNPSPDSEKETNIRQFKEKWGGRYVEFGDYGMTLGSKRLAVLRRAKKLVWRS